MPLDAWLVGDPGRTPFAGHVRVALHLGDAWARVAGRVGSDAGLVAAFAPSRALTAALAAAEARAAALGAGRHALMRAVWECLLELPLERLGEGRGADLSLLLVAGDPRGVGVAGVGLAGAWGGAVDGPWEPLVPPSHPLLAPRGRPDRMPGVLTLARPCHTIVAVPHPLDPELPAPSRLEARCGVRR